MKSPKLEKNYLRYVVPFKIEDMDFETAYKNIDKYNGNLYPDLCENIRKNKKVISKFKWERKRITNLNENKEAECDLYEYVKDEYFSEEEISNNKVGLSWKLTSETPNNNNLFPTFYNLRFKDDYPDSKNFNFSKMGLYLFRNGVGFIWYEIEYTAAYSYEELIDFQYKFKEINHGDQVFISSKTESKYFLKIEKNPKEINLKNKKELNEYQKYHVCVPVSIGNWIDEILRKSLKVKISYFAPRKNNYIGAIKRYQKEKNIIQSEGFKRIDDKYFKKLSQNVPDKAMLFSYLVNEKVTEKRSCEISDIDKENCILLASGYKRSYLISNEQKAKIEMPFYNMAYYETIEGCAIIATPLMSNDKYKNDGFFINDLKTTIFLDYFHLYIRAIYQSYSLLLYSEKTQKYLSAITNDYMDENINKLNISKNRKEIEKLSLDINVFLTKSITTYVCHIEHENNFYNYLITNLRINEETDCVAKGFAALNEIVIKQDEKIELTKKEKADKKQREIEKEKERKKQEEKEKEEKQNEKIQAIIGSLVIFESLNMFSSWGNICKGNNFHPIFLIIGWMIILFILLFSIFVFGKAVIQIAKDITDFERKYLKKYLSKKGKSNEKLENVVSILTIIIIVIFAILVLLHFKDQFIAESN